MDAAEQRSLDMKPTLTLTAYNLGDATEADFDAFTSYVAEKIDDATGLNVTVEQHPFRSGPSTDTIVGATDEQQETIREAVESLWQSWCAQG
jgi:predicted DNA-binding helix-hairpin-helix protein